MDNNFQIALIEKFLLRKSHPKLLEPAPSEEQLKLLLKAALRAPDHALLKPWRYRVFSGEGLQQLGDFFAQASRESDPEILQDALERIKAKALRAPVVIVASVFLKDHPKVPHIEQILSAGAGVQNILTAAHFLGIGAMWRTGSLAFSDCLMRLMGLDENEQIIGFVYLGTEEGDKRPVKHPELDDYVSWIK